MGLGISSNTVDVDQNVMNNILSETSTVCAASCTAVQSGDVIVVQNSSIGGGIGFTESCTVNASCVMNNSIDTQIQNILSSITQQSNKAVTDFLGDLAWNDQTNSANFKQNVTNNVTQVISSTCNADIAFSQNNDLLYVSNTGASGFVGFQIGANNSASANASCAMSNTSRTVVYNNVQAQANQSNTDIGVFAMIAMAVVVVILIGGLIMLIMSARGGGPSVPNPSSNVADLGKLLGNNPELTKSLVQAVA